MNYAKDYGILHQQNMGYFGGYSTKVSVNAITALVEQIKPKRILDYGSGKGYQYLTLRLHERWGGVLPHCYDPGVKHLRVMPDGSFGGIICNDVMEHIEEWDVDETLENIFSRTEKRAFVFFRIGTTPAKKRKRLPDGRNVHVTVKPPRWWARKIKPFERDGLTIQIVYDDKVRTT